MQEEYELCQQQFGVLVRFGGGDHVYVEAAYFFDKLVRDLGEDRLILDAERVIASAVEGFARHAAEVANARQCYRNESVEKFVRVLAAKRNFYSYRLSLAQLEVTDRFLRFDEHAVLSGYGIELRLSELNALGVVLYVAEAHIEHYFDKLRHFVDVFVAALFHELGHNLVAVTLAQSVTLRIWRFAGDGIRLLGFCCLFCH